MGEKAQTPADPRRFYEEALTEAERDDFPLALEMEGVEQEIAVLRLRLRAALTARPEDFALMLRGVAMLVKALSTKYRLSKQDAGELQAVVETLLSEHAPFGKENGAGHDEHEH